MSLIDRGAERHEPVPSRRRVLAVGTAGAAAMALACVPGVARAAGSRVTEPQSRPQEGRVLASLNGTWDFMPTTGTPTTPPASGTWDSIPVPAEWNMTAGTFATSWNAYDLFETPADWDSVEVAWYRRTVDVPSARRGERIVLRFEAVNFEATVFFNGVQVASHQGGLLPFEADVTDQVSWGGTNTVHVLVQSGTTAARQSDGWHYPNGSWWGQTCWGIWQDVWLLARPAVYVQDSYVVTSVSDKRLSVTTTLANVGTAAQTILVRHQVRDGAESVLSGTSQVTVPAGGTATVTFERPWANPRLWSPDDPHLYQLMITTAAQQAAGQPGGDTFAVRFGFREVGVNGIDILLNGEPVMLRGDAWHFMGSVENSRAYATEWFTMVKAAGVNYLRLHAMPYPSVFYDVADEMGLLIVAESGIYGSSGNYALNATDFWDNCVTHLTNRVLRDRNHPSVFAWSAENEMLAAFGQSWAAQVAALKPVVTALDTTRPVYFEGDGDPQGAGDLESTHYPWEITTSNTAIPESAYALAPGGANAGFWDRKKPMLIGEFSSMYYATPSQVSAVGGPATYADLTGLYEAHALIVGAQIEGFRYAGATGVSPWNTVWYGMWHLPFEEAREKLPLPGVTGPKLTQVGAYATTLNPGFQPSLPNWIGNPIHDRVAQVMPGTVARALDYRTHAWGGGTLTRTYAVYHEAGTQQAVTVAWQLTLPGTRGGKGAQQASVPPDGHTDVTFGIPLPAVKKISTGRLTVSVRDGHRVLYTDTVPLTVYPPSAARPATQAALSALVVETGGSTATSAALTALGVTTTSVPDLSTLPAGQQILVLGEGATVTPTAGQVTALTSFVQGGGIVLSLAQSAPPELLPWPVLVTGSPQTIAHVAAPHHQVLDGIGADDLRWWNTSDGLVIENALVKPGYGSLTSIADVGPGLAASALAEAPYGSGTYLFCQFPVIAASTGEPIAAILLRNIIDYLAARQPAKRGSLGVLSPSGSALLATLNACAVGFTTLTTASADTLGGLDALLVDASAADSAEITTADVTAWVQAGGTLWVNGLTASSLTALSGILPAGVALTALDAAHQLGAVTTGKSAIVDGLNNANLDWPGSSTPLVTATVSGPGGVSAADSRAVDWTAFAAGAEQNKYQVAQESTLGFTPASVLWVTQSGKGQVVIDMLAWPAAIPLPSQTTLAAGIAAGLGLTFVASAGSGLLPTTGWTGFASPNAAAAAQAYDRNESTRWSSDALQEPGMYYGVNLGATHTLTRIVWDDSPAPGDLPRGLDIQTSPDGTTYTTVLSLTSSQVTSMTNAGVLTIPLNSVTTQFLKMVDPGSAPGNYLSLYELYLFGQ
ncbi:MAG TPA: glycoside hydrolase family 2 TIM barrel-domain containing protein [Trebonia sp.]|nr:glycoside hydrolase family 2 TIM barrel-domain containing protein [Trebonia sp.]